MGVLGKFLGEKQTLAKNFISKIINHVYSQILISFFLIFDILKMSTLEFILLYLRKMGCICSRQTIKVEGVTYVTKENIGEGGFSTISLVEDVRSKKKYAMKKITCHSTEDQIQAKKEIDYHRKFNHPNILPLIGSEIKGHADIVHNITSDAYLILPYYSKGTLADELLKRESRNDPFHEHLALLIFLQICEGVQHMHQ